MPPADHHTELDRSAIERVLRDHPIRTAVLFGSTVRGTDTSHSDVDLAVEFQPDLSTETRHRARIDLVVDLMEALDTDDVDVADLSSIRPSVGASALRTGVAIVGDTDRIEALRERFEAASTTRTRDERLRAFDDLLDRLERTV